jgi:ACT domain-containing protein
MYFDRMIAGKNEKEQPQMFENNLSMKQEQAISLMTMGKSDTEIGKAVGVSRECVWRWRNENADFVEAARKRREILIARHTEDLNDLLGEALTVVKESLRNGDPQTKLRVALQLLKMSGLQGYAKVTQNEEMSEKEAMIAALENVLPEVNEKIRLKYSCT